MTTLQALVVDDSAMYRHFVRAALAELPDVAVAGHASSGRIALQRIEQLRPDVVILDLHMPEGDGISVLRALRNHPTAPAVVVLTSDSSAAIARTSAALELGAFDFVLKPVGHDPEENHRQLVEALAPRLQALHKKRRDGDASTPEGRRSESTRRAVSDRSADAVVPGGVPEVIVIGISTGGPMALQRMLPQLPADFPVPVLVVQHMPAAFTEMLATDLDKACPLAVAQGKNGERIQAGKIYIAPGGYQMKVAGTRPRRFLQVTDAPPEKNCRPSVDYLFRSVAAAYRDTALAVVMTGMGNDGTEGCRLIREQKGHVITQSADSCVVYGMPRSVVEAGLSDEICPLNELAIRLHAIAFNEKKTCQR